MARSIKGITIDGLDEFVKLAESVESIWHKDNIYNALLVGARLIRDRAKQKVRIGPGVKEDGTPRPHLKDLIYATRGKTSAERGFGNEGPTVIAGVDLKKAPHAHLVEYGHKLARSSLNGRQRRVPANPFMRPAIDESKGEVISIITDMVKRTMDDFSGKI